MMRLFLPVVFLVSMGFHSFGYSGNDFIKESIIDLEQACSLAEHETQALADLADEYGNHLDSHRENLTHLMLKLHSCKARLVDELNQCTLIDDDNFAQNHDMSATAQKSTWRKIGTGCDWLIRVAGVIWALQVFYGFIF